MAAGAMALTNPLLLNPALLFSTSMMQSLQNDSNSSSATETLLKSMKSMLPQMPFMWGNNQFKKPTIADTFSGAFADEEVSNLRTLLESVNAMVTKSLLEDNLKKWASNCGLSADEVLQQLAHAQPLSPGQLMIKVDPDAANTTDDEASSFTNHVKSSSSRPRALISDEQVASLKAYYSINPKPRREELLKISEEIGHTFKVVKVWFQNSRARDRREAVVNKPNFMAFNSMLPPTPPASCSTESQKHPSPISSPKATSMEVDEEDQEKGTPLDLSTKPSTPSASPPPLVINSEAEDEDEDDESEAEDQPKFQMTSRPPIDIDQLAKQHFDNMIRAKLVTLEPTAEAMLPDAPVAPSASTSSDDPDEVSNSPATPRKRSGASSSGSSGPICGPTIYTCDQCDKTFTKKSSITRHKYEHSGTSSSAALLQS